MFTNNFGDDTEIKPYNLYRILEWILCSISLTLAIYILLYVNPLHIVVKSFYLLVAASYFFITLADIIVTSLLRPMLWTSWIICALMGALTFFLCSGILIHGLHPFGMLLRLSTLTIYIVTGCVFLFELLYIISSLLNADDSVLSYKDRSVVTVSPSESTTSRPLQTKFAKREDKANQSGNYLQRMGNNKIMQYPSDTVLARKKTECIKDSCPKKCASAEVPSHGGTFHVSRDVAPILSPSSLRSIRNNYSSASTSTYSPKNTPRVCNILLETQNCQNKNENKMEETVIPKSRTVCTSARTKQKKCQDATYNFPVQKDVPQPSPNNFVPEENTRQKLQETNVDVSGFNDPFALPVYYSTQFSTIPAIQRYYTCAQCGQVHQYNAVEPFRSCDDSSNKFKFQRLPTVHEDSSNSSTDEPTKDITCCPYPSPTSSDSKKLSPCSEPTMNFYRPSTPRFASYQIYSQFDTSFCSRAALGETDYQLLSPINSIPESEDFMENVESHQPPFYNERKFFVTNKEDQAKKIRHTDTGAQSVFNFEPNNKTQETQTQPYQIQRKDDYACTTTNYNSLPIYLQGYGEPNFCSKLYTCSKSNAEGDDTEGMEMHLLNSNMDEVSVLPGEADRSPRIETSNETKHQQYQKITVIDTSDDKSDEPLGTSEQTRRDPTILRRKRLHSKRKNEGCTVI